MTKLKALWTKLPYWQKGAVVGVILELLRQTYALLAKESIEPSVEPIMIVVLSTASGVLFAALLGGFVGMVLGAWKGEKRIKVPWLIAGIIGYGVGLLTSPSLLFMSFQEEGTLYNNILQVLSSGILYFFLAASIVYIARHKSIKKDWVVLTIVLYIFSVAYAFVTLGFKDMESLLILIFPIAYGPFFVIMGFAWLYEMFPNWLSETSLVSMTAYNVLFFLWVYLEFFNIELSKATLWRIVKWIILLILFAMLALGTVSCTEALASMG